ncbi:AraC family transcriptional regulator [Luteimonas sp. BDR2-5]|uniref:AraC family transcriptional regulator n=1 Tax=Proluteimonas luteida TaxID=2878685 RepID=UPI001E3A902E|nr:AraC family transcriptional regulator [Luteimonas sp. BDR2-5]MCD9029719.1 AraC family transcriptional regulator [Luteimonas sp. BDR2-5]
MNLDDAEKFEHGDSDSVGGGDGEVRFRAPPEIVEIDSLRCFPELVRQLGGSPDSILEHALIDPKLLDTAGAFIEYRSLLRAMQCAADDLECPDFGLRLAAMQGGNRSIGPIGVVMKNSKTLGQAIGYCAKNIHAYSVATRVRFEPDRPNHRLLVRLEILLDRAPDKRQAVEHALMLASLNIRELTGGGARVRKILFSHEPQTSVRVYRQFFGCEVVFGQKADGLILTEDDLLCPVVEPDSRVYEMATSFIEARYPHTEASIHARVRSLVQQYLGSKDCTNERIAAEFCLHPRTLQRRLRAEGVSFEDIKDEIRRDLALRYIQNGDMPLKRVAEKLGYAETSVLSRSCFRWFSASPRELRMRHRSGAVAACSANIQQG